MLSYINDLLLLLGYMFSCTNFNCTVWQGMLGEFTLFKCLAEKSLANEYIIITTNLDGFSLVNHR